MRRSDREIKDKVEILEVIKKCEVCHVSFFGEEYPYVVAMNFGVIEDEDTVRLYFHSAKEGTKLNLLRKNPKVGFAMDCGHHLLFREDGSCTMEYESVCGNGIIRIVEEKEKLSGLTAIMNQYHEPKEYEFPEKVMEMTEVLELTVKELTGKRLKKK